MKYDIEKITDFLENENTEITWDQFSDMIFDKFGNECESILGCLAQKLERDVLSKEATEKLTKAVSLINKVF